MSNIKVGNPVPLSFQLHDGDTTKFVRAIVRNAAGALLGTVTLVHLSNGLYIDTSVVMPTGAFATATYDVFDDAGFATRSSEHPFSGHERFDEENGVPNKPTVSSAVVATVRQSPVVATVLSEESIAGTVGGSQVSVAVDDSAAVATIPSNEISVKVDN